MTDLPVATSELNVEVNPGEPLSVTIPIYDGDNEPVEVLSGAVGWSGAAQIRTDWRSTTVLQALDITFVAGTPGAVVFSATAAQTAAWQQAWVDPVGEFDVWVTDTGDVPHCLAAGQIRLIPRNTREDPA